MFKSKTKTALQVAARINGSQVSSEHVDRKWFNNDNFPLVPVYGSKPDNENNTHKWWFNWMFLRLWSMDSPDIAIEFHIGTHWGIGFVGNVPYVRWVLCIPCPYFIGNWVHKNLWRRSKYQPPF